MAWKKDIARYYSTRESQLGYKIVLGNVKHFGFYPSKRNSISMRQAMIEMQNQIFSELKPKKGQRILDAGCGAGEPARTLSRKYKVSVVGIDLLESNIEQAIDGLNPEDTVEFIVGDYANSRLGNSSFDAIYTMETLVHVPDHKKALAEFMRLLKPNGRLVMLEYSHDPTKSLTNHEQKALTTINQFAVMPSFQKFEHGVLNKDLREAGFLVHKEVDVTDHVKPMLKRFWQMSALPYQFIRLLSEKMQGKFINAMAGYELYRHPKLFRISIFVATKPGKT